MKFTALALAEKRKAFFTLFFGCSLLLFFSACTGERSLLQQPDFTEDAEERFSPLVLPTGNGLSFQADPRLDYGSRGTIELIFTARSPFVKKLNSLEDVLDPQLDIENDTLPYYVLLSNSSANQTRFTIFLNRKLTRIGMFNGKEFYSLPFNFRDEKSHHVAFSTIDGNTQVIMDGAGIGELPLEYGKGFALPLHIGSLDAGRNPFQGEIASVRLWSQALSADQLIKNDFYGKVFLEEDYVNSLVAYSIFSNERTSFHYTHEILNWTGVSNWGDLDMQKWVMPEDASARKFMVRLDDHMVYSLGVQYEQSVGDSLLTKEQWFPYNSQYIEEGEVKEYMLYPESGESLIGIGGTFEPGMGLKSIRFITNWRYSDLFTAGEKGEVPYLIRLPRGNKFGGFQGQGMDNSEILQSVGLGYKRDTSRIPMELGVFVHELAGEPERDDNYVREDFLDHKDVRDGALHMHGNYTSSPIYHFRYERKHDMIIVEGEIPSKGMRVDPLLSSTESKELKTLQNIVELFKPKTRLTALGRRIILGPLAVTDKNPIIPNFIFSLSTVPHFKNLNKYRFRADSTELHQFMVKIYQQDSLMNLAAEVKLATLNNYMKIRSDAVLRKLLEVRNRAVFKPARTFGPEYFVYDRNLRYVHENGSVLSMIDAETYHLSNATEDSLGNSDTFPMKSGTYRVPKPYEQGDANKKDPWGATFTMDQRPRLLDFNFKGYNIARLDPQNYQKGSGALKNVFKLPADISRDYQYTSNGKILPYGIFYRNEREAMQRARSHSISSESQHQQAWSFNLGLNIGVPGMSFGASGSHEESTTRMKQSQKTNALSIAFETKHALVMDKSRMQLDPEFQLAVLGLRDLYISQGKDAFKVARDLQDPLNHFIRTFGSHYPYAVTYGGMAYQETALTASTRKTLRESKTSMEASASGSLEEISIGGKIGGGFSNSDEVSKAMETSRTHTRTIGGELSLSGNGGGWSLPDHSEVPVLLDLRPIYELFSPIYFEDSLVWKSLRLEMKDYLDRQSAQYTWDTESWDTVSAPVRFTVRIERLENIRAGDGLTDLDSEYFGSISLSTDKEEVKAWCVNSVQSGDFTCPFPKSLPNLAVANAGKLLSGGKLEGVNIMPINFEKEFYVTKEEYCGDGKVEINFDIHEEDLPDGQDDYPVDNTTYTFPWKVFSSRRQNYTFGIVQGQTAGVLKDILAPGGTEFYIHYSLQADPHNWANTCPTKK